VFALTVLGPKEAEMRIIGCDLHARQQTLAMLDTTTGEIGNTELMNVNGLGQVRVTQMNGSSRKRCSSCVDDEVCANPVRSKRKNLKKLGSEQELVETQ
jgi:hypothetical protein